MRRAFTYEKVIFEMVRELNNGFYYTDIYRIIEKEDFKICLEKKKNEMVGMSSVYLDNGKRIDYEIRYNRLTNLNENYNLLIPGII